MNEAPGLCVQQLAALVVLPQDRAPFFAGQVQECLEIDRRASCEGAFAQRNALGVRKADLHPPTDEDRILEIPGEALVHPDGQFAAG